MYKIQTLASVKVLISGVIKLNEDFDKLDYKIYQNKQIIAKYIAETLCRLIDDKVTIDLLNSIVTLDKDSLLADEVYSPLLLVMVKNCDLYSFPEIQERNQKTGLSTFYTVNTEDVLMYVSREDISSKFKKLNKKLEGILELTYLPDELDMPEMHIGCLWL